MRGQNEYIEKVVLNYFHFDFGIKNCFIGITSLLLIYLVIACIVMNMKSKAI